MSLVMEDQSQPVFRDFLGSAAAPPNPDAKQPELSATDSVRVSQNSGFMEPEDGEASVRGGSTFSAPCPSSAPGPTFPASSDPGTENWRNFKPTAAGMPYSQAIKATNCMNDDVSRKRDELGNRPPYRDCDALEGSRPSKVSRFKQRESDALPSTGDLGLTMQPPRTSQAGNLWLQTSVYNPSSGTSKRIDSARPTAGVPYLARPVQVASGAAATCAAAGVFSRNPASSMQPPPADEGSRTGLQGGIAALINSANAKLPARPVEASAALERSASLDRPKLPLQNGGSDSLLPSHKTPTTSVTRQLTIFYGGHAHVFDDVSPDKADAIMQMAGSNGRSWSTTYAHRSSRSEGSLADLRREKAAIASTSLTNLSDKQNALNHGGLPRKHRFPPDHAAKGGIPGDVQVPSGVAVGDGNRSNSNGRAAGLHGSFYNMKEATSNGQHWL